MAPILRPRPTKGKNQPPPNSPSKGSAASAPKPPKETSTASTRHSHPRIPTQGSPSVSQPRHTQPSPSPRAIAPNPPNPAPAPSSNYNHYNPSTGGYSTLLQPQQSTRASQGRLSSSHNTARTTSTARTTTRTISNAPTSTGTTSNAPATTRVTPTVFNTTRTTSIAPTSTRNVPTTPTVEELRQRRKARIQELCADISASYRHFLEILQLIPLDWSRDERPDPYLKSLLANRMMPQDRECELALAITFAKENWWHFATWPEDVKKYAELERDKRRREWEQRQREWERRHWEWVEKREKEARG